MAKTKTAKISSVFPASVSDIWPRLTRVVTLQYIARPFAYFTPVTSETPTIWQSGAMMRFKLRVFGILPLGVHTIQVEQFEKEAYLIQTQESNRFVPIWNHVITLEPLADGTTRYTDEVEIGAGWRTNFVYVWSILFYHHRQRKWLTLLK